MPIIVAIGRIAPSSRRVTSSKAFSNDTPIRIGREGKTGQIMLDIPEGSREVRLDLTPLPTD
jgi:hypothetical protein